MMKRSKAIGGALKSLNTCLDFTYIELPIEAWESIEHHLRMMYEVGYEEESKVFEESKKSTEKGRFTMDISTYTSDMRKFLKSKETN